ncbi:hypothetical protein [Paenibacillus sp. sgz500958]|uniref:hypothetical protein n=1 Tax=Paenibacillus sp. sgz500958 TaxID=3242475 RepID=UPI0036D2281A
MLTTKFNEYLDLSAQLRPEYVESLGASAAEYGKPITDIVPDAPELLKAIYSAVSGTSEKVEDASLIEFIPGYKLIHIDEYADKLEEVLGILKGKDWDGKGIVLPILTNYSSDFICYYRSEDGVEQVCDLLHDFGDLTVMFDSPVAFLETLCQFYRQEVYFLDEDGYLDCDLIKEGEVGAELNPAAIYWSE